MQHMPMPRAGFAPRWIASLRATIMALVAGLFLIQPGAAQQADAQQTITDQITAFLADDFDTAFDYASPTIRRLFGTPERFGQMVRQGYPMVYRPQDVQMLAQRDTDTGVTQRIMIRDGAGRLHVLDYQMIRGADGWRINGVQLVRDGEAGA